MDDHDQVFIRPPAIEPAVYRIELPLAVLELCDDKAQVMCWLALRWLMAAMPDESGFGTRKIGERAKVNQKYVAAACAELAALGLVERVGEQQLGGLENKRPIYTIPIDRLEKLSIDMALGVLLRWGAPPTTPISHPESQMALDFSSAPRADETALDPKRDQAIDPKRDQAIDPKRDQGAIRQNSAILAAAAESHETALDPKRDQAIDPFWDQAIDPKRDHRERERETERESQRSTRKKDRPTGEAPPHIPPAPPADAPELPIHPLDLWQQIASAPRLVDSSLLAALAAEHDAATGGHGWYWLGRAMLAVAFASDDTRPIRQIKAVLDRWRSSGDYGSDTPAYTRRIQRNEQNNTAPAPGRRAGRAGKPAIGTPEYYLAGRNGGAADGE